MSKKILIVDDEPDLCKVLLFILENEGYEVFGAENGQQALDLVKNIVPDLILLDVYLPVINGDDVAKILKKDEKFKHIPVILMSASSLSISERANKSHVDSFLIKPFEPEDMIEQIKKLISGK